MIEAKELELFLKWLEMENIARWYFLESEEDEDEDEGIKRIVKQYKAFCNA